jgi:hypothetical protein
MAGGMLEYFSMLIGYHLLLLPVMAFYALAMVSKFQERSNTDFQPVLDRS